jgi:hypothetical protein
MIDLEGDLECDTDSSKIRYVKCVNMGDPLSEGGYCISSAAMEMISISEW